MLFGHLHAGTQYASAFVKLTEVSSDAAHERKFVTLHKPNRQRILSWRFAVFPASSNTFFFVFVHTETGCNALMLVLVLRRCLTCLQ